MYFSSFGASAEWFCGILPAEPKKRMKENQKRRIRMYKSFSMELAGRTLTVDIGRVCAQANGAALLQYGETTVLSTATASDKPRDGIDFFPLSRRIRGEDVFGWQDPRRIQ